MHTKKSIFAVSTDNEWDMMNDYEYFCSYITSSYSGRRLMMYWAKNNATLNGVLVSMMQKVWCGYVATLVPCDMLEYILCDPRVGKRVSPHARIGARMQCVCVCVCVWYVCVRCVCVCVFMNAPGYRPGTPVAGGHGCDQDPAYAPPRPIPRRDRRHAAFAPEIPPFEPPFPVLWGSFRSQVCSSSSYTYRKILLTLRKLMKLCEIINK